MSEFNASQELEIEETYREDENILHIAEMFDDAKDVESFREWKMLEHKTSVDQDVESFKDLDYLDTDDRHFSDSERFYDADPGYYDDECDF